MSNGHEPQAGIGFSRPLRILVVYPVPNPDTCNLCAGLRARGHEVEFLTSFALSRAQADRIPGKRLLSWLGFKIEKRIYPELDGVRVTLRPTAAICVALWRRVPAAWRNRTPDLYEIFDRLAASRIRSGCHDVVVSPIGASGEVFAAAQKRGLVRVLNLPIVPLTCLQPELEAERAISAERARCFGLALDERRFQQERAEFAAADGVLAPSPFVELSVRETFKVSVPIFTVLFGAPVHQAPGTGPVPVRKRLRVLFAGQLVQRKGIFDLLEAAQSLSFEQVELVIVGPAPFGLTPFGDAVKRVDYRGALSRSELSRLMAESDVLCLPTLAEGFPLVVLEAMSVGLPVITTDVCRGVVVPGENGLFVNRRAPAEIAAAISLLNSDRALLGRLADGARRTAERFSWAEYRAGTARAIETIAENAAARARGPR